ncbi:hypothetical protein K7432_008441 [Basidiobolus ranarum]|uniref:DUF4209 domain-containing protein n=1 Tax=Basidiobolus ranarum TaxID=34480 RepID=A0ABR2VYN0_9FUNG
MIPSKLEDGICNPSYLSPRVQHLFLIDPHVNASTSCQSESFDSFLLEPFSILNVPKIAKLLTHSLQDDLCVSNQRWGNAATSLAHVIRSTRLNNNTSKMDFVLGDAYTAWLGPYLQKDFDSAYNAFVRHDNITCILVVTAVLDRALGDLLYSVTKNKKHIPFLLKDLLQSDILRTLLGGDLLLIMRVLMGTPKGMNIRNLVWHGFVNSDEMYPGYCIFIHYLIRTIGHVLQNSASLVINHRELLKVDSWYMKIDVDNFGETAVIKEVFRNSFFIPPGQMSQWCTLAEYYTSHMTREFMVNSIVLLEHALRVQYVFQNRLLHNNMLSADSEKYYIILDDLLSKTVNGIDNALPSSLGENIMELLMDLFHYNCNLRLRDRVSHGEVDLSTISMQLCSVVLAALLSLCQIYAKNPAIHTTSVWIENQKTFMFSYRSHYHPLKALKQTILDIAIQRVEVFKSRKAIMDQLQISEYLDDQGSSSNTTLLASFVEVTNYLLRDSRDHCRPHIFKTTEQLLTAVEIEEHLNSIAVSVLFRSTTTSRIVSVLKKTMDIILDNYIQVGVYLQKTHVCFVMRQLSSRHRAQFVKIVEETFIIYDHLLCSIMMMIEHQYYSIVSEESAIQNISDPGCHLKYLESLFTLVQRTRMLGNGAICGNIKDLQIHWEAFVTMIKGRIPIVEQP